MEKKITENKEDIKRNINEMENNMDKKMLENINDMKRKMDENKEEIQNSMSSMILHDLDERLPKGYVKIQGTHETKGSIHVEQPINSKQLSSGFNSNSGVNYGWGPKFNFSNIELKKFDGTKVITWVNQIEKYFELHNIMDDMKMNHIETLNFEIKPYQRYQ
jgi:hypothetical protein